jgi:hypothetical protein
VANANSTINAVVCPDDTDRVVKRSAKVTPAPFAPHATVASMFSVVVSKMEKDMGQVPLLFMLSGTRSPSKCAEL